LIDAVCLASCECSRERIAHRVDDARQVLVEIYADGSNSGNRRQLDCPRGTAPGHAAKRSGYAGADNRELPAATPVTGSLNVTRK